MRSIHSVVAEILDRHPFLDEVVSEGVGNTTEIARRIQPDVEKRLYEKVTLASISMALHRLSKERTHPNSGSHYLKQLRDITVRSKIIECILPNTKNLPNIFESLLQATKGRKDVFLSISQGLHETVIMINAEYEKDLRVLCKNEKPKILHDLSVITLQLPESSLPVPGVYYPILKALAAENISFVEILSVNTELSIAFNDTDVDKAFAVLKRITL